LWVFVLILGKIISESAFHLEKHYGISFGLGIMPFSFILFLFAFYFLLRNKKESLEENTEFEKKILRLEELIIKQN
jgi:hypothetical protein